MLRQTQYLNDAIKPWQTRILSAPIHMDCKDEWRRRALESLEKTRVQLHDMLKPRLRLQMSYLL